MICDACARWTAIAGEMLALLKGSHGLRKHNGLPALGSQAHLTSPTPCPTYCGKTCGAAVSSQFCEEQGTGPAQRVSKSGVMLRSTPSAQLEKKKALRSPVAVLPSLGPIPCDVMRLFLGGGAIATWSLIV